MSDTSTGEGAGGSNDLENHHNKKDSEKNRREQENICIEELAMLISAQIPELSDSDDSSSTTEASRLEKGSILQETVDKLKILRKFKRHDLQEEQVSSSQSVLPKEILGSLVLEALDGFMFIVKSDGKIDFVSDNVRDFLGFQQDVLTDKVIYNFIHHGDHARFSVNLDPDTWKSWKRLPQNRNGRQVGDRSKVFHLRFRVSNVAKQECVEGVPPPSDQYENMQVSAIVMLNPTEEHQGEDPKSGLFCIARKILNNEQAELTPVEQFTTKSSRDDLIITTVDTSGLPDLYKKNIESQVLGKTLLALVHPHDVPLMKEHMHTLLATDSDTSKVYRMVLPPPHNIVHVKTKSRVFTPQPGYNVPGYIMSTHAIIRENELDESDLPGLRPQLRGLESKDQTDLGLLHTSAADSQKLTRVTSPQVQSPLGREQRILLAGSLQHRGFPQPLTSPIPISSPNPATSPFSGDSKGKTKLYQQLSSPSHQTEAPKVGPYSGHQSRAAPSPTNGGNELLKELLKPRESSDNSRPLGLQRQLSSSDNVTLVGLLNERPKQEPPSELLRQLQAPPRATSTTTRLAQLLQGHKRPSSSDEGPAAKQTPPSLEKLLDIRPDLRPIPPLPRKWSEVPQDKLPRDIVIDNRSNNRNNNMGRPRPVPSSFPSPSPVAHTSSLVGAVKTNLANAMPPEITSRIIQNTNRMSPAETGKSLTSDAVMTNFGDTAFNDAPDFRDLMTDPALMKILDTILVDDTESDQQLAKQKIHEIEQQLMWVEQSMAPSTVPNTVSMAMSPMTSSQSGVLVTSQQFPQPGVIRPGTPQHRILQHRPQGTGFPGAGPRSPAPSLQPSSIQQGSLQPGSLQQGSLQQGSLQQGSLQQGSLQQGSLQPGTSMEELLKGVPPNVAIKNINEQQAGLVLSRGLDRQLSSPTPAQRHLSGDPGAPRHMAGDPGGPRHMAGDLGGPRHMAGDPGGPGRHMSGDPGGQPPYPRPARHASGEQVLGPPHRRASGDSGGRQLSGGYTLVEGGQPGARGQAAMAPQNIRLGRLAAPPSRGGPGGRTLSQEDLEAFGLSVEVSPGDFRSPGAKGGQAPQFRLQQQFSHPPQFSSTSSQGGGGSKFSSAAGTPTSQFSPGQQTGGQQQADTGQFRQAGSEQQYGGGQQQFSPGGQNTFGQQQQQQQQQPQQPPFSPNVGQFGAPAPGSHFSPKPGQYPAGSAGGRQQM